LCDESVLAEEVVVECDGLLIELFSYFFCIAASDEADVYDLFESFEGVLHVWCDKLSGEGGTLRGLVRVPSMSKRQILRAIDDYKNSFN
jgi:hypothetical protein